MVRYGFFKVIFKPSASASFPFVYTKAQSVSGPQPTCEGVCETAAEAYAGAAEDVSALEAASHFEWAALRETAQPSCSWCMPSSRGLDPGARPSARAPTQAQADAQTAALASDSAQDRAAAGDAGDTVATLLIVALALVGVCAFLGWYSRRRG